MLFECVVRRSARSAKSFGTPGRLLPPRAELRRRQDSSPLRLSCRTISKLTSSPKHLSKPPPIAHPRRNPSRRLSSPREDPALYLRDAHTRVRPRATMATLALPALRQAPRPAHQLVLSLFRSSPSSLPSLAVSAPALPTYALPSLANLVSDTLAGLRDLLPPILWAAPKSRTTHSAKRMRSAHKGLKEKQSAYTALSDAQEHCRTRAHLSIAFAALPARPRLVPRLRRTQTRPPHLPRMLRVVPEGDSPRKG